MIQKENQIIKLNAPFEIKRKIQNLPKIGKIIILREICLMKLI